MSSLLETEREAIFYCNSCKAIPNTHQSIAKRSFAESFWCRFFQKGAVIGGNYSRFFRPRSAARRSSISCAAS